MSAIDHLLALSVLLALPAYAAYEARRVAALARAGIGIDRTTFYGQTIIAQVLLDLLQGVAVRELVRGPDSLALHSRS
jgi:hypothetical protein